MTKPTTHRWAVDSIHEGVARIEEDGEKMLSIPSHLLPPGVTEGQLLRVTRAADGGHDVLTIVVDKAGTEKAHRKSIETTAAAMAESKKKDQGGDVSL
jgi:hypothetical protein